MPSAGDRRRRRGALPVMQQVRDEGRRRKPGLVVLPTAEAIGALAKAPPERRSMNNHAPGGMRVNVPKGPGRVCLANGVSGIWVSRSRRPGTGRRR